MIIKKDFKKEVSGIKKYKRTYCDFLKKIDFKSLDFDASAPSDSNNIILKNFSFLLRLAKMKEKNFIDEINLIRLISTQIYLISTKKIIKPHLENWLKNFNKNFNFNLQEVNKNFELEISKEFNFSPEIICEVFSFHILYSAIATVFSYPFKVNNKYNIYYKYCYFLVMYLNLWQFSNSKNLNFNYLLFSAKLRTQESLISNIKILTPKYFNIFIIKINRWLDKTRFGEIDLGGL